MTFTLFSNKGGRSVNDDYAGDTSKDGIHCFAVADGMGANGRAAAEICVNMVLEEFDKNPKIDSEAVKDYVTAAHKKLLEKKADDIEFDTAASTVAVLITDGKTAVHAHTGDTRIYRFRHAKIAEVSEDHSASFELFLEGSIKFNDIRTNSERHKLRRAIGDKISWKPDVSDVYKIDSACSFLICTDGFWNLVHEPEMELARITSKSSKGWLKKMLNKVSQRMNNGSDNITAAAICMERMDNV